MIEPKRIVFIRPCCIGDAVMATAALSELRRHYPEAHITWAVGAWSARAIAHHSAIDAILDTGEAAMPWRDFSGLLRFSRRLRAGQFDLALSLVRSPLMSLALWLSGIPVRAGLNSGGRGFGYHIRVPVDAAAREHEAAMYLRVVQAVTGEQAMAWANLPIDAEARVRLRDRLRHQGLDGAFIVAHPGGGSNPGAMHDGKRYPPTRFAELLNRVCRETGAHLILIGGPGDQAILEALRGRLRRPPTVWLGELDFLEIGALAAEALCYIGNDSGLTHLAAASGAATVMLMGPTDPRRYAPYTPDHLALWAGDDGEAASATDEWDWDKQGIDPESAAASIVDYLARRA